MKNVFAELAKSIIDSQTKLFPCGAIHVNREIKLEDGTTTRRLSPLMKIRVTEGFIDVDSTEPTHIINECWGTLSSSLLYLDLIDIKTDQPTRIKI